MQRKKGKSRQVETQVKYIKGNEIILNHSSADNTGIYVPVKM